MEVNVMVVPTAVSPVCRLIVEVGYFDKVAEIKQKVEDCYGIPVAAQRLFFQNQELADGRDTVYYSILHGSHIVLQLRWQVAVRFWLRGLAAKRGGAGGDNRTHEVVHVTASLPPAGHGRKVAVFARREENVAALKRRIHDAAQTVAPPPECMRMVIDIKRGIFEEMKDHLPLGAYVEFDSGVVEVKVANRKEMGNPESSSDASVDDADDDEIVIGMLMEGSFSEDVDFLLGASPADMVATLREQLPPPLAGEDYHFELNGEAMNEELSLEAHGVVESGVTIMIVSGRLPAPRHGLESD
ncbi:hypothetical protein E2562_003458 [Oryza meyeriana var. granulata]|uniref:Ubiquitin-like domain-containing protein n=1 Tax=Oryza meyeriana var. granulata TaxID=110450 RepID=A0A6G1CMS9_9ORYZ|nr:hypothetical protein E2562_003458 [Oryza meyeriana var. granulata]